MWDLSKFKQTSQIVKAHKEGVWSLSYSHDGKTVVSGGPDKELNIWDFKK